MALLLSVTRMFVVSVRRSSSYSKGWEKALICIVTFTGPSILLFDIHSEGEDSTVFDIQNSSEGIIHT